MDLKYLHTLKEYDSVKYCIDSLLGNNQPIVFFEVGAYDGSMTNNFLSYISKNGNKDNKLFVFEPDSRNYHKIINNVNFPINKPNVHLVKKALYSKTGVFNLFLSSGKLEGNKNEYDCCSSLLEPNEVDVAFPFIKFNSQEMVECITIDDFCKQMDINHIDFIYADIQGAESEMIIGAKEMLPNIKFIFMEKSDTYRLYGNQLLTVELIELMEQNNFKLVNNFSCDILFCNKNLNV